MCSVCMSNCVAYSPLQDIEEHKIFARPYETQAPKVIECWQFVCAAALIHTSMCTVGASVHLCHCDCFVQGWLVDMINLFGEHGGFEKFRDRILKGSALNVSIIAAMIRWVLIRKYINKCLLIW